VDEDRYYLALQQQMVAGVKFSHRRSLACLQPVSHYQPQDTHENAYLRQVNTYKTVIKIVFVSLPVNNKIIISTEKLSAKYKVHNFNLFCKTQKCMVSETGSYQGCTCKHGRQI